MFNPVILVSSIFESQDSDTLDLVVTQQLDNDELFAQVETRPHEEGIVMTILVRDEETGEETSRHRFLIKAVEFTD